MVCNAQMALVALLYLCSYLIESAVQTTLIKLGKATGALEFMVTLRSLFKAVHTGRIGWPSSDPLI